MLQYAARPAETGVLTMPGTLYLVSTPIGNLDDISPRAVRVLREVSLVAAEDTRRTAGLLRHLGISTPTTSLHAHNEHEKTAALLERLAGGVSVALVSDAGTPLVSDPGAALVRAARDAGIRVEAVPGASAVLAALVASGLPCDTFAFLGFVPARAGQRETWLRAAAAEPRTVVCFEAPHRIRETLADIATLLGDRQMALARELTKLHEEVLSGTAAEVLAQLREDRGECTLVIAQAPGDEQDTSVTTDAQVWHAFVHLTDREGFGRREAVTALARRFGRPPREIYAAIERGKPTV
jgi:16S rRNA (cytidine1402-2'-O)-methyltransferase